MLHVDDYRDYVRSRSQPSTLFNLLAIEESKVGNVMNDGKNALIKRERRDRRMESVKRLLFLCVKNTAY